MSFSNYKSIVFESSSGSSLIDGGKSGRYATKLIQYTNNKDEKDFKFEVYRCPKVGTCSESNATHIGTRNARGELTYNNNENDTERQYYNKVNKQTKSQANSIKPSGLTATESARYNLRAGYGTQAEIDDTTADGESIVGGVTGGKGGNGTKADFNFDIGEINSDLTNINIEGRQFRDTYKNLYYPEGLGSNRQDRIRFTQKYTQGRKVNVSFGADTKVFQRDPEIKIDGSVTLPIVTGIGDRNAVDWKDESLNPIQALAAGGAVTVFDKIKDVGIKEAFKEVKGIVQNAQGEFRKNQKVGSDMAKAINVYLAQQAVGAQGLLSRATGAILNPNLEMLFGGPKLRSFGFTFRLSPRDASEASQVRQIIRFFKQGMSVKTSSSNVFLKAPNVFDIQYQTYNTDGTLIEHPSINFIKTCALTSCDVQYTPDGTYMTYEDPYRTLTSYQLTLNFGELDPIFDDDYTDLDDDDDTVIGY